MSQILVNASTTPGVGIQNINGDTGTASAVTVTFHALGSGRMGGSPEFIAGGSTVELIATDANFNTFMGESSGVVGVTSTLNSGFGYQSLEAIANASPGGNSSFGASSGSGITSGAYSTFMGYNAGSSYTTENSNISIGYGTIGSAAESNVLRIGRATGTGNGQIETTYICGIQGTNVGAVASVVSINGNQLGETVITGGSGIVVTPGVNTITIEATGLTNINYTSVNHAASPYTALPTDEFISCDVTAGVITIRLPNAPATGKVFMIKDRVGLAATSNITVTTVGGAINIDGATTFVMNTAYEAIQVIFNGTAYEVF